MKTEHQTRQDIIDLALEASGWNLKDPTQVVEEFDILVKPAC
jgi:type I restriction enzyme R subunit